MRRVKETIKDRKYELLGFASLLVVGGAIYCRFRSGNRVTVAPSLTSFPQAQTATEPDLLKQVMQHLSARDCGLIMLGAALRTRLGKAVSLCVVAGGASASSQLDGNGLFSKLFSETVTSVLPILSP